MRTIAIWILAYFLAILLTLGWVIFRIAILPIAILLCIPNWIWYAKEYLNLLALLLYLKIDGTSTGGRHKEEMKDSTNEHPLNPPRSSDSVQT